MSRYTHLVAIISLMTLLTISNKLNIPLGEAMDEFYHSQTFQMIDKGIADMHCRSDIYLIDEFCLERKNGHSFANAN